jgi:hypothetical protein
MIDLPGPYSRNQEKGLSAQLLSHNLPVMIDVLRANFVALHLSEGRTRHPNTATGRRRTVQTRPGVGTTPQPLVGNEVPAGIADAD